MGCPVNRALKDIHDESEVGRMSWGAFRSTHEFYGVLHEEVCELLDAIQRNDEDGARMEAKQVAAVAYRFYRDGWKR